jgi:D-glucosaminate-specific PTS system IIB component
MAKIGLVRIDNRLIHGQVCTQWLYRTSSKKVYIVDDTASKDSFLSSIYKMACPVGVELETISTADAGKRWQENQLGTVEPIFVLFKDMPNAYRAYMAGFEYPELQVGSIGGGVGRKNVYGPISFSDEDAKMLDEMVNKGLHAYFQPVPDDRKADWAEVKEKNYPNM